MAFVNAYNTRTGRKSRIPEHWLGHPRLGREYRLTPSSLATPTGNTARAVTPDEAPAQVEITEPLTLTGGEITGTVEISEPATPTKTARKPAGPAQRGNHHERKAPHA